MCTLKSQIIKDQNKQGCVENCSILIIKGTKIIGWGWKDLVKTPLKAGGGGFGRNLIPKNLTVLFFLCLLKTSLNRSISF